MSNDAHIDKIFKDGLGERNFSNKDAMWQKMEAALDNDGNKRKKRFAFIILFAGLLATGFFIARQFNTVASNTPAETNQPLPEKINTAVIQKTMGISSATISSIANSISPSSGSTIHQPIKKSEAAKGKFMISEANPDEGEAVPATLPASTGDLVNGKIAVEADLIPLEFSKKGSVAISLAPHKKQIGIAALKATTVESKRKPVVTKKISIEAIAGIDALRMNRSAGFYAGIRFNRLLDKGTVMSVGINYASNTVNDKYRLSAKPAALRGETDGKINDIHTIRIPIYFQRQLAGSKFALMAGLVPTYVIDATVYNVPNSFNGNPDQYRKFEMKDINRFNVLFGAGIKYSPVKRFSFELSGSYGFTSLVKDSYVNQSRVNDNFKSIQAGVVLLLK